jgi:hypothetical protein
MIVSLKLLPKKFQGFHPIGGVTPSPLFQARMAKGKSSKSKNFMGYNIIIKIVFLGKRRKEIRIAGSWMATS